MTTKRRLHLLIKRASRYAGSLGVGKLPGAQMAYNWITERSRPSAPAETEWISYEGYKLQINSRDHVGRRLYLNGTYEVDVRDCIHRHVNDGDTVVDIGAHIGHHTLSMRREVGDTGAVVAYEPHPQNAGHITSTIQANDFENVSLVEAALGKSDGESELLIKRDNTGSSSLMGESSDAEESVTVDVHDAVDDFHQRGIQSVDFAKVDIQGGEFSLLGKNKQFLDLIEKMVLEFHPNSFLTQEQAEAVYQTLEDTGSITSVGGDQITRDDVLGAEDDPQLFWESTY